MPKRKKKTIELPKIDFPKEYTVIGADLSLRRPGFCLLTVKHVDGEIKVKVRKLSSVDNKTDKKKCHGQLLEDIQAGRRTLTSFYNIWKIFNEVIAKYGVEEIYAHNARFDYGTLQNTQRWLTKSKYRYFFPFGTKILDTLKMAREALKGSENYRGFCEKNGFVCKNGTPRYRHTSFFSSEFAAESVWRVVSRQRAARGGVTS